MKIAKILLIVAALIFIIVTVMIYFNMKKELFSKKRIDKKYLEKQTKIFNILLIISFVLSVITIIVSTIGSSTEIRENININPSQYSTFVEQYIADENIYTSLSSFPKEIEQENVIEFSEYNRDNFLNTSHFIYLKYEYKDKKDYKKEYERIKQLSIKEEVLSDIYTKYLISNDEDNVLEYVLINDKDKIIIYVFSQFFDKDEIKIDLNK